MHSQSLLSALVLAVVAANPVLNPDFDLGTQSWRFSLDAGGGGTVDWDSMTGSPAAGSARAGNVFIGARSDGWKQCVPIQGLDFAFQIAVASALQTGNSCRVTLDFIATANCIDGTPIALQTVLLNTVNDGSFETLGASGRLPAGTQAVALFLEHVRSAGANAGDSTCHFDHVALAPDTVFLAAFE